jgi:hypothetical protein
MAENESLDLMSRASKRWYHLCERIKGGASDDEIADEFVRNAYKALQNVQKQFADYGVPLEQQIASALECDDMTPLVQGCDGHEYARLIELESRPFDTAESLMERVVGGMADRFLDQMEMEVVGTDAAPDFQVWRQREANWKEKFHARLHELAAKLANRPGDVVRTPSRPVQEREASRRDLMKISLVAGSKRGARR